jgi:hypothetical protein
MVHGFWSILAQFSIFYMVQVSGPIQGRNNSLPPVATTSRCRQPAPPVLLLLSLFSVQTSEIFPANSKNKIPFLFPKHKVTL